MKKLLILMALGALLGSTGGCRIGECWREAWNSRFRPQQQTVIVADPCVVADPCNPCANPCAAPMSR